MLPASALPSFMQFATLHGVPLLSGQLPGTYRLLQVLGATFHQPGRAVAQPARHMEVQQARDTRSVQASQHSAQTQQVTAVTVPYVPPKGVKKTFYKRKLPCPPATEFSSAEGRLLFAEALQQGTMTGFFKLIEQYSTQDEPAFCGLASIAMVLNALSIDPKRPWKGSWRWFHEQLLDCCLPLDTVAKEGVVLTQAACLAKCNGANVTLHRSGTFTLDQFRQAVQEVCSSGEEHLVVSYSRKTFSQTGDGHFSPVGGYHADRDLVLILDTARFKYPPHWVPLSMLYQSMSAVDPTTGKPRGFLRMSANTRPDSVLFTLDMRPDGSWREAEQFIRSTAPEVVQAAAASGQLSTPDAVLSPLVSLAPLASIQSFIAVRFAAHSCARDRCVPHTVRQQVLQELRATPLHQIISPTLEQQCESQELSSDAAAVQQQRQQQQFLSEKLTMLLLLQQPSAWGPPESWADQQQYKQWHQLLDASAISIVEGEVQYLRQQLLHLEDVLQERRDAASEGGSVCNTCLFQLDCSVKGCVKDEHRGSSSSSSRAVVAVAAGGSGVASGRQGSGSAAAAGAMHHWSSDGGAAPSGGSCCSCDAAVADDDDFQAGHGCCS